jgi:hypothetical protein
MSDFPTIGDVVLVKDIDYYMVDYFDRMNINLELTLINDKTYTASVGRCYNNVVFFGEGTPYMDDYSLQLKTIKSVKIIS